MNRSIKKVAVLGSGVMGSRIACHFAGIGVKVLLLDIPAVATAEQAKVDKNKIVNDALTAAVKSNPSPVFTKDVLKHITTGNFDDNLKDIAGCDWVIEVVIERLDIKQSLYERVEQFRKPGTLITSNTSGIPIHLLSQGRSEDFKANFCGTHFFNPPRYLRLLEIIPTPDTKQEIIDFLMHYGDLFLGKTTVLCKDTPAFIANRIGVFSIMAIFNTMTKLGLSIDDVDSLTGPVIGRPKSATFRTADVVGIDTLVKVAEGVAANCADDEAKAIFNIPGWLQKIVANKWLGDKTKQGFFKKIKTDAGSEILTLDLNDFEYKPRVKPKFASIDAAKQIDDLKTRLKTLVAGKDKAGEFYRDFHYQLLSYVSNRIPEISDDIYQVDDAMKAGFGWEIGPFETWDLLGVAKTAEAIKAAGLTVAAWVDEFVAAGNTHFYKISNGKKLCYSPATKNYEALPGGESFIILSDLTEKTVWKNAAVKTYDIGDGVLGMQWQTKSNTIGGEVLEGIQKSIALAEKDYKGLVIANEGANFSLGANVGLIFMYAIEQDYDELDMAVRMFQNTMMRVRYSSIPVVVAPHGMTLGGGCELCLHADKIQAAAETYIGLVEMGVGLIPGGGGTKEFALRAGFEYKEGELEFEPLKDRFFTIGTAKVATSAFEAFDLGIMRKGIDAVSMNLDRRVADAKQSVIEIYDEGYTQPQPRNDIKVLGRGSLGALYAGVNGMRTGNYITDHDVKIAKKLAYVMSGGDLSESTLVSEQYLLDIEREAFLSLCGERKTLERIQSVLKGGKPVRN
ncbi:3-hydroxyacyl-CoA dehydrogenase/enoyl-CoA hydratase family protein [Polluticaenibacter yanchengensis]|uniref:3-hydroxyacyl-CoA dehydrogenase/enoyl-CoA hydratase family protein n=1 Tax=Polluticaenibacter yanchengensis TaxID=3014562 RepID=A0ABT4ULT3_9BACT|nr:3-hydroxyacyl-CoA dehydrogenase/enoyl-CoA hydratase family protein [Chitinophagaceae bacterium LY-5]